MPNSAKPFRLTCRSVESDLRYENCSGEHRLPVQITASIFSGTRSFLNLSGMPATRCGICRSPMMSTSIPGATSSRWTVDFITEVTGTNSDVVVETSNLSVHEETGMARALWTRQGLSRGKEA